MFAELAGRRKECRQSEAVAGMQRQAWRAPTAREWVRAVYDYGGAWLDGYRNAGNAKADSTGEMELAGALRDMELSGERP